MKANIDIRHIQEFYYSLVFMILQQQINKKDNDFAIAVFSNLSRATARILHF